MKRITVLGCGLVGSVIARDLASDPEIEVAVFDVAESNLARVANLPRVRTLRADLSSANVIINAVAEADAVVGAVPGRMGLATLKTVIGAGKPISDISFSPEGPLVLDALAKEKGVTAIVDCGVSPGLSNVAIGRAASKLTTVDNAVIYVGGIPVARHWPYEYVSVFSPTDVIEEYTRPARMIENGRLVVKTALSEPEPLDFPGIGTLEAFNTDGLRTLIHTVKATNMKEKTLRYPGHIDRMRMLRETGFFGEEPINVKGTMIVPRELTEKLLFKMWHREEHQTELTVLRIFVEGEKDGARHSHTYDLLDYTDPKSGATSMARTTGFPCSIMALMLAKGQYSSPGVQPPEVLGRDDRVFDTMVAELKKRGVEFTEKVA